MLAALLIDAMQVLNPGPARGSIQAMSKALEGGSLKPHRHLEHLHLGHRSPFCYVKIHTLAF